MYTNIYAYIHYIHTYTHTHTHTHTHTSSYSFLRHQKYKIKISGERRDVTVLKDRKGNPDKRCYNAWYSDEHKLASIQYNLHLQITSLRTAQST
jgi:hypothetical protein